MSPSLNCNYYSFVQTAKCYPPHPTLFLALSPEDADRHTETIYISIISSEMITAYLTSIQPKPGTG